MATVADRDAGLIAGFLKWNGAHLSLSAQYAVAGCGFLLLSTLILGSWVVSSIEAAVTEHAAVATAVYMDGFIRPQLQGLPSTNVLPPENSEALDLIMETTAVQMRVHNVRLWSHDGALIYSTRKDEIGRRLEPHKGLTKAWQGKVAAELIPSGAEADDGQRTLHPAQLEVYSPIRAGQGDVVAVAEYHEDAQDLSNALVLARWQSWLVAGGVALMILAGLFWIVARGSRTIDRQQAALRERVQQLSRLLAQNEELHDRLRVSAHRTTELNERYLRRLGSDLHDGPAQMLGLALLRLERLRPSETQMATQPRLNDEYEMIEDVLSGALKEVRQLCNGLALPEIERLPPKLALLAAVNDHERRTLTAVSTEVGELPHRIDEATKTCLYRFIQEGLNNAFRHAGGVGQEVRADFDGTAITVEVSDRGPGISAKATRNGEVHMGLAGLRDRIVMLGGRLDISSRPNRGTRLTARLPIRPTDEAHG